MSSVTIKSKDFEIELPVVEGSEKEKAYKLGIKDLKMKYVISDMVKDDVIFCASGVTDGDLVGGIKKINNIYESETFVLHKSTKTNKIIRNKIIK